jgi:hypothetical protein
MHRHHARGLPAGAQGEPVADLHVPPLPVEPEQLPEVVQLSMAMMVT